MIKLPFQFPDPLVESARLVREFQSLAVDERVRQLFDIIETSRILARCAPDPTVTQKLNDAYEAEWQRRQRELFQRHGF